MGCQGQLRVWHSWREGRCLLSGRWEGELNLLPFLHRPFPEHQGRFVEQQRGEARVIPFRAQCRDQYEEPYAQRVPGVSARHLLGLGVHCEPEHLPVWGKTTQTTGRNRNWRTATFRIPNTQARPMGLAAGQRLDSIPAPALAGTALLCEPNTLGVSRYTL